MCHYTQLQKLISGPSATSVALTSEIRCVRRVGIIDSMILMSLG
jgi:hypothetical protein